MDICIIGVGYVGLVSAACFAHLGHRVIAIDNDKEKIKKLLEGIIPIYEPELEKMVKREMEKGRLSFSSRIEEGVEKSRVVFICVGTPPHEDGEADLSSVEKVVRSIAHALKAYCLIVEKSTVPVNTWQWIRRTVDLYNTKKLDYDVAVNPEFLREGSAIKDFLHPDRIVIGVENERAKEVMLSLYKKIDAPKVITDLPTAEIIKHASNSFLATKISFINALANICEGSGADIEKVSEGMGYDKRIGPAFLKAGIGYGGFCFPKDLAAFIHIAEKQGYNFTLLKAVQEINKAQRKLLVNKIKEALWILKEKTVGILGLSFKPDTDDLRLAPSIEIIEMLQAEGAKIKAYDPAAMEKAKKIFKAVSFCKDPYKVARDSDCLVILTEWKEFKELDLKRIKQLLKTAVIVDGRNIYDPEEMKKAGFIYKSIGRQ